MSGTFLDYILRDLEWEMRRKIRNYIIGMVPEPVRKIVGWILLIFGIVAILGFWIAAIFWLTDYMMICVIGILVGIGSIGWGITLLRHKG